MSGLLLASVSVVRKGSARNAFEKDGIGSTADQTGPMGRDGSRTGRVSASQATSRLEETPTVTMTMAPIKSASAKLSTGSTRAEKVKSPSFSDAELEPSRTTISLNKSRNGN